MVGALATLQRSQRNIEQLCREIISFWGKLFSKSLSYLICVSQAGVILQLVVLLVLCVHFSAFDVIFRWINKNKTAHDGYSLNLNVVHRSRRSVHLFVAVFVAILTFAISASYFLTHPEHSSRHYSSFLFESSSGCFNRENSVCEIVSSLNRDTRVHVRHLKPQSMRPQSTEVDIKHVFDIDVSCRVSDPGRDLLLRIELSSFASHTERILGYNEASRKSSRQRPLPPPRSSAEQTFSLRVSDGVQVGDDVQSAICDGRYVISYVNYHNDFIYILHLICFSV